VSLGLEENTMSDAKKTLYERLGGYEAIAAVVNDLLHGSRRIRSSAASWRIAGKTASSVRSSS
jgi:hypothetical protein